MWSVLPFGLLYLFPLGAYWAITRGGAWCWFLPLMAFLFMPALDFFWDRLSPSDGKRLEVSRLGEWLSDFFLMAFVPTQLLVLALAIFEIPSRVANHGALSWDVLGLTLSLGILTGGIGITLAHELVHRREKLWQWGGLVLLSSVFYGHFAIEHVLGHHTHVGTKGDPASARRGENLWFFVVRSVVMGWVSAWKIERQRLERVAVRAGKPTGLQLGSWLQHRMFQTSLLSALFLWASFWVSGVAGAMLLVAQAAIAVFLLEAINYVEHYGLTRKLLDNGKPEPVQLWHSWDSHSRISSWVLIHLSRHADHHKYPARPFYKLEGSQASPLLPASYPACVLLATLPPIWYRIMHARLDRFSQPELGRIGNQP